jgi:phosphatidyl-myo-inositol alpha-mannosyltransferase
VRIAFVQRVMPPLGHGGVSHQVDLLARTMVERGHDITIFTVEPTPGTRPYRTVLLSRRPGGPLNHVFGSGLAFRAINTTMFDVVHAHGDDWAMSKGPSVRTFYGTALQEVLSATSTRRRISQTLHYGLELVSSRRATVTTAISRNTRKFIPGIDLIVPCAVDRAYQPIPVSNKFPDPTILLVAGLLGGRKRGHLVLSAFREVRKQIPNAKLILITREDVNQPGVTALSDVPTQELATLFQRSWALCSASSYEGFGVPLAEAMASGLPVISTPNLGAREVLREGELGRIVEPNSLAKGLLELLTNENLASDLRKRGLEAAQAYALDSVCSQYESAYLRAREP